MVTCARTSDVIRGGQEHSELAETLGVASDLLDLKICSATLFVE